MSSVESLVAGIQAFLPCATPDAWVKAALQRDQEPTLLIDHANCEKKAAATALALMRRYTDNPVLLNKMSRLAREELRHFEQVSRSWRRAIFLTSRSVPLAMLKGFIKGCDDKSPEDSLIRSSWGR